jgi:hypothetical protein
LLPVLSAAKANPLTIEIVRILVTQALTGIAFPYRRAIPTSLTLCLSRFRSNRETRGADRVSSAKTERRSNFNRIAISIWTAYKSISNVRRLLFG